MTNRDAIYNALFQRLKTKLGSGVKLIGRRNIMPPTLTTAQQPAVFVVQAGEERKPRPRGTGGTVTLHGLVIAYCYDEGANPDGTTQINNLLGAIQDAIAPDYPETCQLQTLGGLVYHCWVEGKSDVDPGVFGQQQVAVIPVMMLLPEYWTPVDTSVAVPPPVTSLRLQTNEADNGSQRLLDLHAGLNITLSDDGNGRITITSTASGGGGGGGQRSIGLVVNGSGNVPGPGSTGYLQIPYACTIQGWTLMADQVGSVHITIKKCAFADLPATVSIVGASAPALVFEQFVTSAPGNDWTTAIAAGDVLEFVIDSIDTLTKLTFELRVLEN